MKSKLLVAALLALAPSAFALEGQYTIHDPSTLIVCDGKFYTWGTGGNPLVSDDGWTWRAGTAPSRTGLAPDVIHIGDRYYMYIARNVGGQPRAEIEMISNKTLDPASTDFKWEAGGIVATTDGIEDCNGIDPGVLLDPTTQRLWLTYGSYFGYIRLVELDPKTGKRLDPNSRPVDLAINCEASIMIQHDGWYYLLATHGSCCQGANSNYNIRMGRARSVTGPFLDHDGVDMMQGGGKLFLGSEARVVGPGHFGLLDLGQGVQVFSYHYEADLDRGGSSVLAIRPVLWRDGWPVAGENAKAGTYMIESARTGTALELAVEGVSLTPARGGPRGGRGPGGGPPGGPPAAGSLPAETVAATATPAAAPAVGAPGQPPPGGPPRGGGPGRGFGGRGVPGPPIAPQDVAQVSKNWPEGNIAARMANYLDQAQQKWTLAAVAGAGGYPGAPYFKITIAGTDRALAATPDGELITLPAFTGGPEQLWRIQQLTDGTYRIMPKSVPGGNEPLALSAIGAGSATLAKFNPASDRQRWNLKGL
jgi:arabinan endo-1,5-alpha-L-arabinosidase